MPVVPVSIPENKLEQVFAVAFAPAVALSELIKNASDSCYIKNDIIKVHIDEHNSQIRILDNGYGFSLEDIELLGSVTNSSKMSTGNEISRIGEYYAGSKGQGIFTAFNLCTELEIQTYSQQDKKSYNVTWKLGSAEISYHEATEAYSGTALILKNVNQDSFKMLKRADETQKLLASSILYYEDSLSLPNIEIYINGELLPSNIKQKIDLLYDKFKTRKSKKIGLFAAKASFKYDNDTLVLSYEDNEYNIFNFNDLRLDLKDPDILKKISNLHGVTLHKPGEVADALKEYIGTDLDPFSGVLYVWVDKTSPELSYKYGVPVYVNNYGLYNYLNCDNDWLGLSPISQNVKANSYKAKNTFGYVHLNNYNETTSKLKISNDRNSFLGTYEFKKFEFLMRDIITNLVTKIDMAARKQSQKSGIIFQDQARVPALYVDEPFNFRQLIKVSDGLSLHQITLENNSVSLDINYETGEISASQAGNYKINFTYNEQTISKEFTIGKRKPDFDIRKKIPKVKYHNSLDLKELINQSSIKELTIDEIEITSDTAIIQGEGNLSHNNSPGSYEIYYKASKYGIDIVKSATLEILPVNSKSAAKLKKRFVLCERYSKINDVIKGIAESYEDNPTFASISIRPLVEISLKAFIYEFYSNEEIEKMEQSSKGFNLVSRIDSLVGKLQDNAIDADERILTIEGKSVQESRRKIKKAYEGIEPNDNVHALLAAATAKHVFDTMSVLSILINFIIKAINAKYKHN